MEGQNYRLWTIWRVRSVRFLDYRKVKDAERDRATELFGTPEAPTALAAKVNPDICLCTPELSPSQLRWTVQSRSSDNPADLQ